MSFKNDFINNIQQGLTQYCDGREMTDDCKECECDLSDCTTFGDVTNYQRQYVVGMNGGY